MNSGSIVFDSVARRVAQPEIYLAVLAFAFHTAWEFLQDPLYAGLSTRPHSEVRAICLRAAGGDLLITFIAFYAAALVAKSRTWIHPTNFAAVVVWFATGILITIALEWRAAATGTWSYGPSMPIVPVLHVGLAPIAQWIVIPILPMLFLSHCVIAADARKGRSYDR